MLRLFTRLLVLPSLALTLVAPAHAVVLGGRLGTPSDVVPALTVHAWSPATGRLHSVTTTPGEATYSLDLPAGRYVVFATPADPGAPPVYGAHTQFSVCARDATSLTAGGCREHALVEVEVARRRVENVDVTDWYLDDATLAKLDGILGRAAEAVDEAQLAAPKFSEYPAVRLAALPRAAALQPEPDPRLERDRAALTAALAAEPNFAGRYALVRVPCTPPVVIVPPEGSTAAPAPACEGVAVLDLPLGRAFYPEAFNPLPPPGPCTDRGVLQYRRDSRLLTLTAREGDQLVTRYYVWDGESGRLRAVATLASAIDARCAPAAGDAVRR